MEFVEEILGIESTFQFQQEVTVFAREKIPIDKPSDIYRSDKISGDFKVNSHAKPMPYEHYMSQLTEEEFSMFYSIYYQEFRIFGYDPCEGFN